MFQTAVHKGKQTKNNNKSDVVTNSANNIIIIKLK
jgi:hypothetical protein